MFCSMRPLKVSDQRHHQGLSRIASHGKFTSAAPANPVYRGPPKKPSSGTASPSLSATIRSTPLSPTPAEASPSPPTPSAGRMKSPTTSTTCSAPPSPPSANPASNSPTSAPSASPKPASHPQPPRPQTLRPNQNPDHRTRDLNGSLHEDRLPLITADRLVRHSLSATEDHLPLLLPLHTNKINKIQNEKIRIHTRRHGGNHRHLLSRHQRQEARVYGQGSARSDACGSRFHQDEGNFSSRLFHGEALFGFY